MQFDFRDLRTVDQMDMTCPLCGAGDGLSLPDSLTRMRACLDCELDIAPPECEAHRRAILSELEQTYTPQVVAQAWARVLRDAA